MDHGVDGRVLLEDLAQRLLVGDVDLVELGAAAADELDAVERDLGRIVEVIDYDDIVAVLEKRQRRERANVAGATIETEERRSAAANSESAGSGRLTQ